MRRESALQLGHAAAMPCCARGGCIPSCSRFILRPARASARRGMVLVIVLAIVSVLALLGASFSYRMKADLKSVEALQDQQQALYAAQAGIDRAILLLRKERVNTNSWYNNYKVFRRIPVYVPDEQMRPGEGKGGSESVADQEKVEGRAVWRTSVVAYEWPQDETSTAKIRYGVTDEAAKVNLNIASRSQLLALFDSIRHDNVTSEELADALIDWRDKDDEISPRGAESSYYLQQEPAYRAKNGPLTSVEELLMIKGFDGRILYGEDYNRNGYLDENEDDGEDGAFPPDDGDGKLNQGLLPYVTVYSWDWNRSNDNKLRVDINTVKFDQIASGGDEGEGPPANGGGRAGGDRPGGGGGGGGLASIATRVPTHITEEIRPEIIDFIAEAQKRGYRFKSVGDLLGLEVYEDGSSNHDQMWRDFARQFREAERRQEDGTTQPSEEDDEEMGAGEDAGGRFDEGAGNGEGLNDDLGGGPAGGRRGNGRAGRPGGRGGDRGGDAGQGEEDKNDGRRLQSIRNESGATDPPPPPEDEETGRGGRNDGRFGNDRGNGGNDREGRRGRRGGRDRGRRGGDDNGRRGERNGDDNGRGGGQNRGTPIVSPVEAEDMAVLFDRLTVWNSPVVAGLININTAPPAVLRTLPGLDPEDGDTIVEKRVQVDETEKLTPAWLVTSGALTPEKLALISNLVTSRSIQFTIDSIGFADHVGAVRRVQAVVEMRGELAQIKYFRDITSLGIGYPVWDDQRSEGFAFSDQ